jgi:hypothetical protein
MTSYFIQRAQHGEDVLLVRLFRSIGTTNRVAVDCGAKDGIFKSNTARFRQKGWRVVAFDCETDSPLVTRALITAENINAVLARKRVPAQFDLLSIDIDGNDFWIWDALTFQPRVVIVEYNPGFGSDVSVTVPYDPSRRWDGTIYFGASARALWLLGQRKGYRLHAYTRSNLIFVRADLVDEDLAPEDMPIPGRAKRPDPQARPWQVYP